CEAKSLKSLPRPSSGLRFRGRSHVGACVLAVAPVNLNVQPAGDVEQLAQAVERKLTCDRTTRVGRMIACLSKRVKLVLDDFRNRLPESFCGHQVVQIVREWRAKSVRLVDGGDDVFDETALLQQGTRRILMGIALGERCEVGEDLASATEKL